MLWNKERPVYAVPGNIDQVNSYGTNNLIKQGAKLVMNAGEFNIKFFYLKKIGIKNFALMKLES